MYGDTSRHKYRHQWSNVSKNFYVKEGAAEGDGVTAEGSDATDRSEQKIPPKSEHTPTKFLGLVILETKN